MNRPTLKSDFGRFIGCQWDRNAEHRFVELNSGRDKTYSEVLCPMLCELLRNHSLGHRVLDAGCGLGFLSDYIGKRGFDVTGIDIASECISIARRKFPLLNFCVRDIVEFADEAHEPFDACVANMLFHNVPDIEDVAAAIFGLLAPGGILVGCIPHPEFWFWRKRHFIKHIPAWGENAYLARFKIRGSTAHPARFTYFHRKCVDYEQVLSQVGFARVETMCGESISGVPDDLFFFFAKKQ